MNKREAYILEQLKKEKDTSKIGVDIPLDLLEKLNAASKEAGMSLEDFFLISIIEKFINIRKEKYKDQYENITDVFEFYRLEEIMDKKKDYLVINPMGKDVMLIPYTEKNKEFLDLIHSENKD